MFLVLVYVGRFFFLFKQKTAYEMRISDWSSDVCSSDLIPGVGRFAVIADPQGSVLALFKGSTEEPPPPAPPGTPGHAGWHELKIGRASCRERVCQYV